MIYMQLPPKGEFLKTLWYLIVTYYKTFLQGLSNTLLLAVIGTIGGFILSFIFLYFKTLKVDNKRDNVLIKGLKKIANAFAGFYITVIRGTPMIVQAVIVYYGLLPYLRWSPLTAGLFIITFNTAAYIAEILRSGINGIDPGQNEAARSLGFNNVQSKLYIVYPQAIKNSLPAIGNEFIVNLKDSSIFFAIGIMDLFNAGKNATSGIYRTIEGYVVVALIYLVLTVVTSRLIAYLEKRRNKGGLEVA